MLGLAWPCHPRPCLYLGFIYLCGLVIISGFEQNYMLIKSELSKFMLYVSF